MSRVMEERLTASMRLSELKYKLIYTSKSIEQIAKELHFPDTSYMCRYFRRKTGRALDEYRKEMK